MNYKLIAYALDFTSFLLQKTKAGEQINNIILFGSVARGESGNDSDIDIFVDIAGEEKKITNDLNKCLDDFMKSAKYANYWRMLNIKNEIRLTIGELNKWEELQPSILSDGILLYGKFKAGIEKGVHKVIFVWENVKPNSKRVLFNKQMFGYKQGKKFYNGLIQKYHGERLGKGIIIAPLGSSNIFHQIFKRYKIPVKIKKFLEY